MDWNFVFNIEDGQWHPENWPSTSDPEATVNHTYFFDADPNWIDNWPTDHNNPDIPGTAAHDPHAHAEESLHLVSQCTHPIPQATTKALVQNPQEISEPSPTTLNPPPQHQSPRRERERSSSPHAAASPKKKRKHQRKTKTSPQEKRQRKKAIAKEAESSSSSAIAASSSSHHHHQHHQHTSSLPHIQTAFQTHSITSPSISAPTTAVTTAHTTPTTTTTTTTTTNTNPIEVTINSPTSRVPHKAVEKKYRDGIKTMFRRLRAVLPGGGGAGTSDPTSPEFTLQDGRSSSPPNLTKAGVIGRAIDYIQQLEGEKAEAQRSYEAVVRENKGLKRRVAELERQGGGGGGGGAGRQRGTAAGAGPGAANATIFPTDFSGQGGGSSGPGFGMF